MPHFEHAIALAILEVMAGALTDAGIGVLTAISSRSVIGRRVTYWCAGPHTVGDIEPDERSNIWLLLAFEWTQAAPQSVCRKDVS